MTKLSRRVAIEQTRTARSIARRNGVLGIGASLVLMSFVIVQGGYRAEVGAGTPPEAPFASQPDAPTVTGINFAPTGDSLRVVVSDFSGGEGDSYDSLAIQVDSIGKNFASTPQYFNDTLGAVLTDTVPAIDSGAVVIVRAAQKAAAGGWSNWSEWDTVSMVVTDGPLIFVANDWEGATGTSAAAVLDSASDTPWDDYVAGGPSTWTVIDTGTALGFPSDGVVRLNYDDDAANTGYAQLELSCSESFAGSGSCSEAVALVDSLENGDSLGIRFYVRAPAPGHGNSGDEDSQYHGVEVYNGGANPIGFAHNYTGTGPGGNYSFEFFGAPGDDDAYLKPTPRLLHPDSVYRIEYLIWRGPQLTDCNFNMRAYGTNDATLLYDGSDLEWWASGNTILEDNPFTCTSTDFTVLLREWRLGVNGYNDTNVTLPATWAWFDAWAICGGWCGPYVPGEARNAN